MRHVLMLAAIAALLSSCHSIGGRSAAVPKAVATLAPTTAGKATGIVHFEQRGDKVLVIANVQGLTPGAEHGFHVHDTPDCSGDGTKAGGHFNPDSHPHAHPSQAKRHAGALFNLKADANGVATFSQEADTIRLTDGQYSVIGRPLIVHAKGDDYASQPAGNAGPRIACGLIAPGGAR